MESTGDELSINGKLKSSRVREFVAPIPLLSWLLGALVAVALEHYIGTSFAQTLGLRKAPMLFGFDIMLKQPTLIHSALTYLVLIYFLPIIVVARLSAAGMNGLAAILIDYPLMLTVLIHLGMLYAILHWWSNMSLYRADVLRFTLIAVLLTLSLNLINGYMGEFSCSHPGFMALGAYASSVFTLGLFADDRVFGPALLPQWLGPYLFPVALVLGGVVAAVGALAVAIPSFRTRGDYLAIISLAFMFIVKSLIENLEFVGGPRGLGDQPGWANRPVVFVTVVLGIWIINNFVRSTLGKALNAVRDNEMAADAMTVDTRQTKITAFLFGAFWAGVAGGLYAHALRYINPGSFGIQMLAEGLAMVYFGGLNSVYGSIVGACSISLLGEMLRPLELFKWIIIPLLLILVMIFRPTGLIAFREFDVKKLVRPKQASDR
ncbi:MAG: branched-chain amino acid ABC transporter permease [Nitrospirae bacterium]|nr:branched-chain amino acid ABC transporter permease [Nitrospirota bacterium]